VEENLIDAKLQTKRMEIKGRKIVEKVGWKEFCKNFPHGRKCECERWEGGCSSDKWF